MARDDEPRDDAEVAARNRRTWDQWSDGYAARHGELLSGRLAEAWGLWRLEEKEVRLLGDVEGRSILELGCGAANWSRSLARRGAARVFALDISAKQLDQASASLADVREAHLIQANAEAIPLRSECVDLVISDYGGMSWGAPDRTVPEVARVLSPGGRLVFCTHSPWFLACVDAEGVLGTTLHRPYFGMRTRAVRGVAHDYQIPYGDWIELFRAASMTVDRLLEVRPEEHANSTFQDRSVAWARQWPAENIWVVTKPSQ